MSPRRWTWPRAPSRASSSAPSRSCARSWRSTGTSGAGARTDREVDVMKDRSIHEEVVAKALFDTLDESERRAVEAHLAACAACAEEVRALRGVLAVTAERVRPEPPPAFWDGYARRVEERLAARMEAERQASWSGRLDA